MSVELKAWLSRAVGAALEAGRAILDVYRSDDFDVQLKSDDSPLTRADRLAHIIIVKRLSRCENESASEKLPTKTSLSCHESQVTSHKSLKTGKLGFPVLSEEGADIPYEERKTWSCFWLVDPLDGTKEFIKQNGEFTVNIALIEAGRPVLGVVFAPELDRLYFGVENMGAFRMDNAMGQLNEPDQMSGPDSLIACSTSLPLKDTIHHQPSTIHGEAPLRLVASRSHMNEDTRAVIRELEDQYGEIELVQAGSSLKLCLVAEGSADMYPRLGPTMEWDTAAAHAVVSAAGGTVTVFGDDASVRYNKPDLLNPHFLVRSPENPIPD